MCVWVILTKHSDVDAGRGSLVFNTLVDMADVVSTVGHRGKREDQEGAHVHGGQDVCQRLNLNNLEERKEDAPFYYYIEYVNEMSEILVNKAETSLWRSS